MLLIFCTVFLELIIREAPAFQLPDEPRMYPQRSDVTVDAHSDLTLGCRGVEPMNWTFRDDYNDQYSNSARIRINWTINEKEVVFKYESILTVYNVSRVNIGFYYCYAQAADYSTARRARRIYVFVHDENYLSVITSKGAYSDYVNRVGLFPCRPTSPDISITLKCNNSGSITLTVKPDYYTGTRRKDVSFHPHHGFQVHIVLSPSQIYDCECVFTRSNKVNAVHFKIVDFTYGFLDNGIEGPNTANVGDDITLQCTLQTAPYFPYYNPEFKWNIPNDRNTVIAVHQPIKLKNYLLLNATITIKNISTENEGAYTFVFFGSKGSKYLFINDKKTNNYSAPWIHPSTGGEIQMNSGENITLRCSGSRPVAWRAKDEERTLYIYNQLNITTGKYEAYLHISALRYTDTGFYYCHENDSRSDHPFKSDKMYIFVKDEKNLYLPSKRLHLSAYSYTNMTLPCLPTSQNINVSLSLMYAALDPITWSYEPEQMIDSETCPYNRREGFSVQVPGPGELNATCTFTTGTIKATQNITVIIIDLSILQYREVEDPIITGPSEDLVFVGQTLELSCAVLVYHNVPEDALRWTSSSNASVNKIIPEVKRINLRIGKVLVSTLILDNVKISDRGRYSCHLDYATTNKFISVYDKFDFEPNITTLHSNVAYVGQPFAVLCNVSVDHNVELPVLSWTTPNETQVRAKIMGTEYIPSVRNIEGRMLLQIDNVTYDDAGNYTCSVSDFTNRRKQVTRNIEVKGGVKPRIVRSNFVKEEEMDVIVEGTVDLICDAEGDPEPVITWIKGSSVISSRGEHIILTSNNTQLTIHFAQKIDTGRYTCIAQNPFGEDSHAVNLSVIPVVISGWYTASLIGVIILIAIAAGLVTQNLYKAKKRRSALIKGNLIHFKAGQIQYFNPFLNVAEQTTLLPYDTKWEIPRNKVALGRNLGSGSFGLVVEATVSNFFEGEPERTVAVKMLHPYSNFMDLNILISELKIMTHLGEHDNLINLLGACTENIGKKRLLVVLEYCRHGNLRNYLMENRCNFVNLIDPDTELICFPDADSLQDEDAQCSSSEPAPAPPPRMCTLQLLRWALQAARGMEFLAAKQILHGDLAARNILLTDNLIVKISDFGLSRNLISGYYKKKSQCPLPIKWMAIESIRDKTFSTQSDVWAFGVVLWELFSLARIPYGELEPDLGFYRKLESGYRLERPEYSTRELYQVMRECWCAQSQCRPPFPSLTRTLNDLLRDPRTVHVDAADDSATPEGSFSAASVVAAQPVDCVALDIDVLTTTDTL